MNSLRIIVNRPAKAPPTPQARDKPSSFGIKDCMKVAMEMPANMTALETNREYLLPIKSDKLKSKKVVIVFRISNTVLPPTRSPDFPHISP